MTKLLDGKLVRDHLLSSLKLEVASLKKKHGKVPGLAVILVGDHPASQVYVSSKKRTCDFLGIHSVEHRLSHTDSSDQLRELIAVLNKQEHVHGILLQLPLPKGFDEQGMLSLIHPDKDVDGFHPVNVGKLLLGLPTFQSCTPYGICELMKYYDINPSGQHVVIVGRSNIVGKPLAALLVQKSDWANATVTICHSQTTHMSQLTQQADILVAAIGRPGFIRADMVKPGAVVIDVGINRVESSSTRSGYQLLGDVDFEDVKDKVSAITPVPGGVGPMTIAMLMKNTVSSFVQSLSS